MDKGAWKASQEAQRAARQEIKNARYLSDPASRAEVIAVSQDASQQIARVIAGQAVLIELLEQAGVIERGAWMTKLKQVFEGAPPEPEKTLVEV